MQVKILGSAAGGGFPQWNCACPNCRSLRAGTFQGKSRTQTQLAISADSKHWFLLGASPDLHSQIEVTPELHPQASDHDTRRSPISGAVLLNADVDHVLGLLLLRELQPLRVHATESVRRILTEDNSMFAMLNRVPDQLVWTNFTPGTTFALLNAEGEDSRIRCSAISLGDHFPAYVSPQRRADLKFGEASLGLIVHSPSGKRMAYLPAVPKIGGFRNDWDVVLFDGTFWSDDELIRVQGSGQTARQMGHVPVFSEDYGDDGLSGWSAFGGRSRKIYVHINNTNPMLDEASAEHRQVRKAGWEIAEDGWQFDL